MAVDPQQLAQQFIDALHTLEQSGADATDDIVALFSDDTQLTNAALKLAGKQREGQEGARTFWTEYRRTFGEASSEFFQITTNEQSAGLFWTTKGTDAQGEPLAYDGVSLLVFNDAGKITQFRGYYDTRDLTRSVSNEA